MAAASANPPGESAEVPPPLEEDGALTAVTVAVEVADERFDTDDTVLAAVAALWIDECTLADSCADVADVDVEDPALADDGDAPEELPSSADAMPEPLAMAAPMPSVMAPTPSQE